jgi:L-lactate dehydrogenase complex protein LldE
MEGPQVQLFVTCLVDALTPEVGRATVDALEKAGCSVGFPTGQGCCGQPAFNVGLHEEARVMAAHTLDLLDTTEGPVVIPSGSCTAMITRHYEELFAGSEREEQVQRVGSRARELTQFLVDDIATEERAACDGCTFAYHYSCHGLRDLGLGGQADALLDGVTRAPLEGDRDCCGFGGLFAVEMPAVSTAIMDRKLDSIEASGADIVVGSDVSCLLHLAGGLRRRGSDIVVKHIAELLGDGHG